MGNERETTTSLGEIHRWVSLAHLWSVTAMRAEKPSLLAIRNVVQPLLIHQIRHIALQISPLKAKLQFAAQQQLIGPRDCPSLNRRRS